MSEINDDWRYRAACKDEDPEIFSPEASRKEQRTPGERRAIAICMGCVVREACLNQGMYEEYGVWGGMTEQERRLARRKRVRRPKAA